MSTSSYEEFEISRFTIVIESFQTEVRSSFSENVLRVVQSHVEVFRSLYECFPDQLDIASEFSDLRINEVFRIHEQFEEILNHAVLCVGKKSTNTRAECRRELVCRMRECSTTSSCFYKNEAEGQHQ